MRLAGAVIMLATAAPFGSAATACDVAGSFLTLGSETHYAMLVHPGETCVHAFDLPWGRRSGTVAFGAIRIVERASRGQAGRAGAGSIGYKAPGTPGSDRFVIKAPAKVASLEDTAVPEKPEPDLNRSLQSELKRVGCYPGTVDDQWSEPARLALRKFARYANLDHLGDHPDQSTLLLLRAKTDPVCPSVNHAAKPNKPAQTAKSAEAPRAHPSQRCFMAQGRQFCE